MVPGAESCGLVAPKRVLPALTTFFPYQIMAQTGPDDMYLTSPGKNGF